MATVFPPVALPAYRGAALEGLGIGYCYRTVKQPGKASAAARRRRPCKLRGAFDLSCFGSRGQRARGPQPASIARRRLRCCRHTGSFRAWGVSVGRGKRSATRK